MAELRLANPNVIINNVPLRFKPNSVVVNDGQGEVNVETQTSGGGDVETVHAPNVETKIGTFKGTLITTASKAALVRDWQQRIGANAISVTDVDFDKTIPNCSLTNNPDLNMSQDGVIELEFMGDPAV